MTDVLFCESFRNISDKVITRAELRLRRRTVQMVSSHFVKEGKKDGEKACSCFHRGAKLKWRGLMF